MNKFLILVIIILLSGCSRSAFHLRQAKKHILKAELLGAKWEVDTVFKEIAVPVPSVRHDTVFNSLPGDTVVIQKDRLKVT